MQMTDYYKDKLPAIVCINCQNYIWANETWDNYILKCGIGCLRHIDCICPRCVPYIYELIRRSIPLEKINKFLQEWQVKTDEVLDKEGWL